jgi:hypothetical protein
MPACRFVVRSVSVEPNIRGQQMRRLQLQAIESDAFVADEPLPDNVPAPAPVGNISVLVSASYAKRFQLGDEFDVSFREAE